jgi:hypothetical protein
MAGRLNAEGTVPIGDRPFRYSCAFRLICRRCAGGAEGTRTPDPLHAMQVRYQLRHSPELLLPLRAFSAFPEATQIS